MALILGDESVIPSFAKVVQRGAAEDTGNLSNLALRMGEVKKVVYPDDPLSITKKFVEYTVEVQHRDGRAPGTTTMYHGCTISNLFGGAADRAHYTLRAPSPTDEVREGPDGVGVGSKVLMLCVNGQTTRAMILGGQRDVKTNPDEADSRDDGHNYFVEFNGISLAINKFGEAKFQFRGPTRVDGTLDEASGASAAKGPSTIEFLKDGSIKLATKDGQQSIHLDHANKKASMVFDRAWDVQVNQQVTESYGSSWQCTAGSSVALEAGSSFDVTAGSGMKLVAGSNIRLQSTGVLTGAATDATLLGTSYRLAQAQLHATMSAHLASLSVALAALSATPVAPVIAPLTTAITGILSALQTFEAQGPFLSLKNKSD